MGKRSGTNAWATSSFINTRPAGPDHGGGSAVAPPVFARKVAQVAALSSSPSRLRGRKRDQNGPGNLSAPARPGWRPRFLPASEGLRTVVLESYGARWSGWLIVVDRNFSDFQTGVNGRRPHVAGTTPGLSIWRQVFYASTQALLLKYNEGENFAPPVCRWKAVPPRSVQDRY